MTIVWIGCCRFLCFILSLFTFCYMFTCKDQGEKFELLVLHVSVIRRGRVICRAFMNFILPPQRSKAC